MDLKEFITESLREIIEGKSEEIYQSSISRIKLKTPISC